MRSLMLALGACLFALNFAGCSSTGSCGGSCGGQGLLGGGILGGRCGASSCSGGCGDTSCSGGCGAAPTSSCGDSSCSGDCGNSGCADAFNNINYGGQSGLGLGLMEAGPSCGTHGCNGGCNTCLRQRLQLQRPHLAARLKGRIAGLGCGCGGSSDCGCDSSEDCGCDTPAPTLPESDCGCDASGPVEFSMGDSFEGEGEGSGVELASHEDRRGLLGKWGLLGKKHQIRGGGGAGGCGIGGCGGPGGLCSNCLSRLHGAAAGLGGGLGLGAAGAGTIPHRDPTIHGGGGAGPAGQIPTYAYPYYTTRAPRDFLDPNPPTIGY